VGKGASNLKPLQVQSVETACAFAEFEEAHFQPQGHGIFTVQSPAGLEVSIWLMWSSAAKLTISRVENSMRLQQHFAIVAGIGDLCRNGWRHASVPARMVETVGTSFWT